MLRDRHFVGDPRIRRRHVPGRGARFASASAFTMFEVIVAMFVTILMGTALLRALLMTEDWAGRARLTVIARAIVQRNCDAAVGVTFTGTTAMPAILNYASGSVRSDTGTTQENINVTLNAGSTAMVSGTLTQTVVDEPTPTGLVASLGTLPARRITFQIDYDYHSRHYTWAQAVVRSQDQ